MQNSLLKQLLTYYNIIRNLVISMEQIPNSETFAVGARMADFYSMLFIHWQYRHMWSHVHYLKEMCCGTTVLYPVKICYLSWFNKMLIDH